MKYNITLFKIKSKTSNEGVTFRYYLALSDAKVGTFIDSIGFYVYMEWYETYEI